MRRVTRRETRCRRISGQTRCGEERGRRGNHGTSFVPSAPDSKYLPTPRSKSGGSGARPRSMFTSLVRGCYRRTARRITHRAQPPRRKTHLTHNMDNPESTSTPDRERSADVARYAAGTEAATCWMCGGLRRVMVPLTVCQMPERCPLCNGTGRDPVSQSHNSSISGGTAVISTDPNRE